MYLRNKDTATSIIFVQILLLCSLLSPSLAVAAQESPDLIVIGDRIETSENVKEPVEAFAVTKGIFSYVGSKRKALKLAGRNTRILQIGKKRLLPGLVDAHIHPIGIVEADTCDLGNEARTLAQIADVVHACLIRYQVRPGEWLTVAQWNSYNGNEIDVDHPTFRAALDRAAPNNPVQLLASDGHHGAFNSSALKLAQLPEEKAIGLTRETLAAQFKAFRRLVAVDVSGEPSGLVNEEARALMGRSALDPTYIAQVMKRPQAIVERLNSAGITAFLDAAAQPELTALYDALQANGQLSAHVTLAQFYDPSATRNAAGGVDYDKMVADAVRVRDAYRDNSLIRADTVKLFIDGVIEGDPLAVPPTLPSSPSLRPYLQPVFGRDQNGRATFSGRYVEPDSPPCRGVRSLPSAPEDDARFLKENGFHPSQCTPSSGRFQHEPAIIMEYIRRMHKAGMSLHIHSIGDAATHLAVDALEAARRGDPVDVIRRPDTLAHLQLVSPEDVARIGRNKLFLAMTYAWIYTDKEYDLSVIPFVQKVSGDGPSALHEPGSYYEQQAYPVAAMQKAGGVLVAGSDAPVETRDPRPFFNMQSAILRSRGGTAAINVSQAISIQDVVKAYTINGAKSLGRDAQFGSIAVGKSADFIIINQDIFSIPSSQIGNTTVEQTWFRGELVYVAK